MSKVIAHLGPPGTYGEEAAVLYSPGTSLLPLSSHLAVMEAVREGMAGEGVVALENSLNGPVVDVTDHLIHGSGVYIRGEIALPVNHCLLAMPGILDIEVIFSHPQALEQCRRFLEEHHPEAELVAALSTVAAVKEMLRSGFNTAAIASARAAELYGVKILFQGIQDSNSNKTRFVVVGQTDHPPTGDDKTSLCFSFEGDKPGQLVSVLGEFSQKNINLSKVESRPTKTELGRYVFLIDAEGHRLDPPMADAIYTARKKATGIFKILGSYPRFRG